MSAGIYGWNTGEGGTHFHRLEEPLRVARELGIPTAVGQKFGEEEFHRYETVIAYELSQEAASEQWQKLARIGRTRLVFDIDDAMWQPDWAPFQRYYTPEVVARMFDNARVAHVVTTSSWVIADYMERVVGCRNVHFAPYTVPAYTLDILQRGGGVADRFAAGFAGSASHEADMDLTMHKAMAGFLRDNPDWDWHFWGKNREDVTGWPDGRTHTYPWTTHRQTYYRSLMMDLCIAPLKGTMFNRSKSAIRFIENSALGIPSIIQDLDPYWPYLEHGYNGYYVGPRGYPSWWVALNDVAANPVHRAQMAAQARSDAAEWTTEVQFGKWFDAWNSV